MSPDQHVAVDGDARVELAPLGRWFAGFVSLRAAGIPGRWSVHLSNTLCRTVGTNGAESGPLVRMQVQRCSLAAPPLGREVPAAALRGQRGPGQSLPRTRGAVWRGSFSWFPAIGELSTGGIPESDPRRVVTTRAGVSGHAGLPGPISGDTSVNRRRRLTRRRIRGLPFEHGASE
jgi:hypothetical protein